MLHELLTLRSLVQRRVSVFVAINKTDLQTAQESAAILAQLEKEV
jgi:signal recognition particle receptor subunit beta